jgi:DNA-binding Lrp family transcriptional regulator
LRDDLLVRLVSAYGPYRKSKIARRMGVSRETVARGLGRLEGEGLGPRPNIRMDRLGLSRFIAFARPGRRGTREQLNSLFGLMGDYAYLEHYQKLDPLEGYLMVFSIPSELVPSLREFADELMGEGILRLERSARLSWMRYHPIRGEWRAAEAPPGATSGPLTYVPEETAATRAPRLDYGTLLILAALQAKPGTNLGGLLETVEKWAEGGYDEVKRYAMARPDWKASLERALKLVDSFPVHLSRGDPDVVRRKRRRWASFTVWWDRLESDEVRRAAMASTSIPYLRTDAASAELGCYFAVVSAPSRLVPSYLDFLSENAPARMGVSFPSHFANFSLPFPSFSLEGGCWVWKKERLQRLAATTGPA